MAYNFKCGFCKQYKDIALRSKIALWLSNNDIQTDNICSNCVYKMINVFKSPTLTKSKEQMILSTFGVKIPHE